MPDERWGEAPRAFVVLRTGATETETELRSYARDHLAHLKCPNESICARAAENSQWQGPKGCLSRQARDFEAVTALTM
jgi:fatty-acyl-CoA synthase